MPSISSLMPLKLFFMALLYHIPPDRSMGCIGARSLGVLVVAWSLSGQGIRQARCGLDEVSSAVRRPVLCRLRDYGIIRAYFWIVPNTEPETMEHRHLHNGSPLSAAAIDDIIDRGGRTDWAFLRDASRADASVMEKIRRVCSAHCSDSRDQKYHLWGLYAG